MKSGLPSPLTRIHFTGACLATKFCQPTFLQGNPHIFQTTQGPAPNRTVPVSPRFPGPLRSSRASERTNLGFGDYISLFGIPTARLKIYILHAPIFGIRQLGRSSGRESPPLSGLGAEVSRRTRRSVPKSSAPKKFRPPIATSPCFPTN